MPERRISTERLIAAPARAIFDVLVDPTLHPVIDGSGTVRQVAGNPPALVLGSRFRVSMRILVPYSIKNTVVEYERDRLIAWRHVGGHRWRYELEPEGDGTRVIETFDWSTSIFPPVIEAVGYPRRNLDGMVRTLERLDRFVVPVDA